MLPALASRGADVPNRAAQREVEVAALEVVDDEVLRLLERRRHLRVRLLALLGVGECAEGEIRGDDGAVDLHASETAHAVLKLAHVAWPRMRHKRAPRSVRELDLRHAILIRVELREM